MIQWCWMLFVLLMLLLLLMLLMLLMLLRRQRWLVVSAWRRQCVVSMRLCLAHLELRVLTLAPQKANSAKYRRHYSYNRNHHHCATLINFGRLCCGLWHWHNSRDWL